MGLWEFIIDHFMQFIHFIHGLHLKCASRNPGSFHRSSQSIYKLVYYHILSMSQKQQITPVPVPIVYEDKQEMLNGNSGLEIVPHPQPSVPDIKGVQCEGEVGAMDEEPTEAIVPGAIEF